MKYFSEKLNKTYDTVEALELAEKEYEESKMLLQKLIMKYLMKKRNLQLLLKQQKRILQTRMHIMMQQ